MKQFLIDEDDYECYIENNIDKTHKGGVPDQFPCLMITNDVDNLYLHEYEYPKKMFCQTCKTTKDVWKMN